MYKLNVMPKGKVFVSNMLLLRAMIALSFISNFSSSCSDANSFRDHNTYVYTTDVILPAETDLKSVMSEVFSDSGMEISFREIKNSPYTQIFYSETNIIITGTLNADNLSVTIGFAHEGQNFDSNKLHLVKTGRKIGSTLFDNYSARITREVILGGCKQYPEFDKAEKCIPA